jgi:hypothetical protein
MGHDRTMSSSRTSVAIVLVSLVTLAACGGSDADSDGATTTVAVDVSTPATEPAATTPPATESAPTDPPATDPPATDPPASDPPATEAPAETAAPATSPADESGADCLVGDWVITEEEMNAYYDALEVALAASGPAPTIAVAGQVLVTFTPTDYTYTANFDLTLGVAGQEGTGASTGNVTGSWTPVDGVIVTETTDSNLSVSVSIGGITLDGSELANGLLSDAPLNAAPFDCAGPTLDFLTGPATPRHTVTLTPA